MKKVDRLGRIVIPSELREKYGMTEGKRVEILDVGEGITVKAYDALCKICRAEISDRSALPLCNACIEKAAKEYKETLKK